MKTGNKNELRQNMESDQHEDDPMESPQDEDIIDIPRHETMKSTLNEIKIEPRKRFPAPPPVRSPVRAKSSAPSNAFKLGKPVGIRKRAAPPRVNTNIPAFSLKPNTFVAPPPPGPMSPLSDGTGLVRDGKGAVFFVKNGTKARVTLYGIPIPNGPFRVRKRKPRRKFNYEYITAGVKRYGYDVLRLLAAQAAVNLITSGGQRFWPTTLEPTFNRLLDIWGAQEAVPKKSSGWFI